MLSTYVVLGILVGAAVLAGATTMVFMMLWKKNRKHKYIEHDFE
jgi:hypothetical protein